MLIEHFQDKSSDIWENGWDPTKSANDSMDLKSVIKLFQSTLDSSKSKSDAEIVSSTGYQEILSKINSLTERLSPAKKSSSSSSSSTSTRVHSSTATASSPPKDNLSHLDSNLDSPKKKPTPQMIARTWKSGLMTYADVVMAANSYGLSLQSILQSAAMSPSNSDKAARQPYRPPDLQSPATPTSAGSVQHIGTFSNSGSPRTDDGNRSTVSSQYDMFVDGEKDSPTPSTAQKSVDPKSLLLFGSKTRDQLAINKMYTLEGFKKSVGTGWKMTAIRKWYGENGAKVLALGITLPSIPTPGGSAKDPVWSTLAEIAVRVILHQDQLVRSRFVFKDVTPGKGTKSKKQTGKHATLSSVSTILTYEHDKSPKTSGSRKTDATSVATKGTGNAREKVSTSSSPSPHNTKKRSSTSSPSPSSSDDDSVHEGGSSGILTQLDSPGYTQVSRSRSRQPKKSLLAHRPSRSRSRDKTRSSTRVSSTSNPLATYNRFDRLSDDDDANMSDQATSSPEE